MSSLTGFCATWSAAALLWKAAAATSEPCSDSILVVDDFVDEVQRASLLQQLAPQLKGQTGYHEASRRAWTETDVRVGQPLAADLLSVVTSTTARAPVWKDVKVSQATCSAALGQGLAHVTATIAAGDVALHADRDGEGRVSDNRTAVVYLAVDGGSLVMTSGLQPQQVVRVVPARPGRLVSWDNHRCQHRYDVAPALAGRERVFLGPVSQGAKGLQRVGVAATTGALANTTTTATTTSTSRSTTFSGPTTTTRANATTATTTTTTRPPTTAAAAALTTTTVAGAASLKVRGFIVALPAFVTFLVGQS